MRCALIHLAAILSVISLHAHQEGIPGICNGPRPRLTSDVRPTTFLFAHGLGGNSANAHWYAPAADREWHILKCPYYTFNFPDVGLRKGELKYDKVNIGQEVDIQALTHAYKDILQSPQFEDPQEGIVIVGDSRGAITALNAAAKKKLPRLRALVCIGAADTPLNVIDHVLARYHLNWEPITDIAYHAISKFWYKGHNPNDIQPLFAVKHIDPELFILLVHAEDDEFASVNSSRALYYALLDGGHNPDKIFLLVIPHGKHGKYNLSDLESAHILQVGVNAFYSWVGAPYDPVLADEGQQYLRQSQPSLEEIKGCLEKEAPDFFNRVKKIKQKRSDFTVQKEEL